MQIHNDEVLHRNRAHSASSIQLNGRYGSACLPAGEKFQEEIFDARCVLKRGGYSIRLADSPEQHNETSALIKRMYSWRGYDTDGSAIPLRRHVTLEAFRG